MSHPHPTTERLMTKQDLDIYLGGLNKQALTYRINKDSEDKEESVYAIKMLDKLDQMAVQAIARYHNQ